MTKNILYTLCPRSSDPFYIVSYEMKWVNTSWTDGKLYIMYSKSKDEQVCDVHLEPFRELRESPG